MNWKATIICTFIVLFALDLSWPAKPINFSIEGLFILMVFWALVIVLCIAVFKATRKKPDSN
jgi:hypothetical protein